ncbi:MAG: hypothetical protein LBM67_03375 [Lentimicrobiaceae bacterium]|jgi:hypothetical protein|nr:hypothetical protein [Lentimicrobiaceae bacterium]
MGKIIMKKSLMILVAIIGFGISVNAQKQDAESDNLLAYTTKTSSTTVYEVLVYANSAVNDLCDYFGGSMLDYGLNIYCKYGGDIYICTAYKVVSVACTINGAVKLVIDGATTDQALDWALNQAKNKVLKLASENGNFYLSGF